MSISQIEKTETSLYKDLEQDIEDLKNFAEPLHQQVVITPLMPVIARIINLPQKKELLNKDPDEITAIEAEVKECKRLLEEISYEYIKSIIKKPEPSKVFKILKNADLFEKELRKHIGEISPEIVEQLTRYRFSIGTPPVTPESIETIERIIFGGNLHDIYGFRELFDIEDRTVFDRLMKRIDKLIEQSTHYTNSNEKTEFEQEATEFTNLEGLRGFTKSTITGNAKTAIRLIKQELFSKHENGGKSEQSQLVKVVEDKNRISESTLRQIAEQQDKVFVIRVSAIPHHIFTTDELKPKWKGIIGRLILIDDSDNSHNSGTTIVYSLNPEITETLDKLHVKDSGTPANTQMNLRLMLEDFRGGEFKELREAVKKKVNDFEKKKTDVLQINEIRKKEWLVGNQKDYFSLKRFLEFLDFIIAIKNSTPDALREIETELLEANKKNTMDYFFKPLKGKGYNCIPIPQGGGRRELKLIGKFQLQKNNQAREKFRQNDLEQVKARLNQLKKAGEIPEASTETEKNALLRSMDERFGPNHPIRQKGEGIHHVIRDISKNLIPEALRNNSEEMETGLKKIKELIESISSLNLPGWLRIQIENEIFDTLKIKSAGKRFERGKFRKAGNIFRKIMGILRKNSVQGLETVEEKLRTFRRGLEEQSIALAEELINDLEKGTFFPHIAMSKVGWTFSDVFDEEEFPSKNYIHIAINEDGSLNPESLEKELESIKDKLVFFPELFEIYTKSIILIVNDPHNPTSSVASNQTKLKLLQIASKYNLTVISDEAYRKQVDKGIKKYQGDPSLAEFYEQNRSAFPNPVTIYVSQPTTKWAIAGGRRTGALLTNASEEFSDFIKKNLDAVNTMSLYFDNKTLETGLLVKKICKELEPATQEKDPIKTLESIFEKYFASQEITGFAEPIYFSLIEARNQLDHLKLRSRSYEHFLIFSRQYLSEFISDLKNLRLDKRTQRDSLKRASAAMQAVENVSVDFPGLKERSIKPQGPFYFCVQLDEKGPDPDLQNFLEAISRNRKIDVVPTAEGYVRFSFGGLSDGTDKGYELLSLAIETDLRILLKYWDLYKQKRNELNQQGDLDPKYNALKAIFPGGKQEFLKTAEEKKELVKALNHYKEPKRKKLAFDFRANTERYLASIEPDSPGHIVTINGIQCEDVQEFVNSKPFRDLFNHYLLEVKAKIPELIHLTEKEIFAHYGALEFGKKFKSRRFRGDKEKDIFGRIVIEIAKIWFDQGTIKILADSLESGSGNIQKKTLMGSERILHSYISQFIKAFTDKNQEQEIADLVSKPTFQAGYQKIKNVKPNENLPSWLQKFISMAEFAGQSAPTDPSPEMITGGTARVAGFDRGMFKRDGKGNNCPESSYFSKRIQEFIESMNSQNFVCKMVQVGGDKVLLVMNRSFSHYLAEELRLFPQFELSESDMKNLRPDAISFLGLPTKVIGDEYKVGYFFDNCNDGIKIPVSWVDTENVTDYMGYVKKPILSVANEKVKEKEGLPIHGSAVTIEFKNGLRKTIVMGGDSGTGKSETIIAMLEQVIKNIGGAKEIKSIQLLAGDMLSLWEGDDGQMYMVGTEQGDFMRMTDIPEDYQKRYRDLLDFASKTNIYEGSVNPRATISGICDPDIFLKPVRVNMFFNINNFEQPSGNAFREVENPRNLILDEYIRGYRGEKGTSGDQPNIYASVMHSNDKQKDCLLEKYQEDFDRLLGWEVILSERGKPKNAILKFKEVEGEIFKANKMVNDLFKGRKIERDGKKFTIVDTGYDVRNNHFTITLQGEDGSKNTEKLYREEVFNQVYTPIASTYCGNPFVDPRGMDEILSRFSEVMEKAGVITGTLYTQLKVQGREFSGPAAAAQSIIKFILEDRRITQRFQKHKNMVNSSLIEKYGAEILNLKEEDTPIEIMAYNLFLLERAESDAITFINKNGNPVEIETPIFKNGQKEISETYPSLLTPEMEEAIKNICENEHYAHINLENFQPDLSKYQRIQAWNSREELIYQVLLVNGIIRLGYDSHAIEQQREEVKKAEKIAKMLEFQKGGRYKKIL